MSFSLTDIGLVLDIAGACLLLLGSIIKASCSIFWESTALSDWNPYLLKTNFQQSFQVRVGAILLSLGFLAQITGNHCKDFIVSLYSLLFICIFVVALCAWAYRYSSKYAEKEIQRLKNQKMLPE